MSEKIEGVPDGLTVVRIGIPSETEWYMDPLGKGVRKSGGIDGSTDHPVTLRVIVEPDNVYNSINLKTLVPEGFEYVRFGYPDHTETWLSAKCDQVYYDCHVHGVDHCPSHNWCLSGLNLIDPRRVIVRKVKKTSKQLVVTFVNNSGPEINLDMMVNSFQAMRGKTLTTMMWPLSGLGVVNARVVEEVEE